MYTKFHELSDTDRALYLLKQASLHMMYKDKKVTTIEIFRQEKKLPGEIFDFLFDMKTVNANYKWSHLSHKHEDHISAIDGERYPVYYHKIYLYKECI